MPAAARCEWQFLAYVILTLGETMVSITGLEFSYTQAPNKMKSAVMALWLFTVSMGNLFTAAVNYFIRNADGTVKMNDQQYYLSCCPDVGGCSGFRGLRDVLPRQDLPAIAGSDTRRTGHRADALQRCADLTTDEKFIANPHPRRVPFAPAG